MFLTICVILGFGWALFMGWKFYRSMDWDEPADPSPDLQSMHKREAQLMMVQEILETGHGEGKLSKTVVEEFQRYSNAEIDAMRQIETAWKNRHKSKSEPVS